MLHLYGIFRASEAPQHWLEVEEIALQTVTVGNLAAVVSAPLAGQTVQQALFHNRIVEATLEFVPLLPARFSVPISEQILIEQLKSQEPALHERLSALRFNKEFAVRAELPALPEPSTDTTSGRAYLASRAAAQRINHARMEFCLELQKAIVTQTPILEFRILEVTQNLYRLAFLVAQDQIETFREKLAAVLEVHAQNFLRISFHGAFAPYSFTQKQEES